jgi:glutamine synthetase
VLRPAFAAAQRRFLTTIISHLNELGYGVYQNDHEDANGQFEINWRYADAMTTADQVSFFKFMVKRMAEERGWALPSCPSRFPIYRQRRAYAHLVWDVEARDNLFLDKNDTHGLSSLAYAFHRWSSDTCQGLVCADGAERQFL